MLDESEGILWLVEKLLASQEALCCMELADCSGFQHGSGGSIQTGYNIIRFKKIFIFLDMHWIELAQGMDSWQALVNAVMNLEVP